MRRFLGLSAIAALAAAFALPAQAARIVSYSVAQCWGGSTTGLLPDGTYATLAGDIPLAAWTQPVAGASDTTAHSDSRGSTVAISKYWDGSAAQTFTDIDDFTVSARITGGTNLYGPSAFSDFRSAINQALNCNGADNTITFSEIPFSRYDVIIYFSGASVSGKRTDLTIRPVQVNGGNYIYPQSATPGDNATASKTGTWGDCTASELAYGTNAMRVNRLTGKTLTLGQYCQNYGIAAVQIIENTDPYRWGNLTTVAGEGVEFSSVNYQNMSLSYGISFDDSSNLGYAEIGSSGTLRVSELKLALAQSTPTAPTGVSISDGTKTISSTGVTTATGVIYGSASQSYTRSIATFTFDADEDLDTTKTLTMTLKSAWRGTVVKPMNTTTTDGTWSPVFQLVGAYTPVIPRSIAVNFNSNQGTAVAGSGYVPADTWNNVAAAAATDMALTDSDGAASGATLTSSGSTYQWTGASDPVLKGYIDDGAAISIVVRDIPFANYDVIVYQATDTAGYGFNPPSINGTYYSYDGTLTSTTANDTALKYGQSQQLVPAYGKNVVYVRGGFTGDLTIVGAGNANSARGCIAAIQIVEAATAPVYRATVQGTVNWSALEWTPEKPSGGFSRSDTLILENAAAARLTIDEDVTASKVKVENGEGQALTMAFSPSRTIDALCDFSAAAGGVAIDASGLDGTSLAKNAVAGAPYSHWLCTGAVKGTPTVTGPAVPSGYSVSAETLAQYGVRLIVAAPTWAQFDAISVNLYRANPLGEGVSGLYPVDRTLWTNLTASANSSITFRGATFTCSANASSWAYDSGYGDIIYRDYMDDTTGATKSLAIANIPFSEYRIIVYFNSDDTTATKPFYPMTVNDVSYAGVYADGTASGTVKGSSATWGRNGQRGTPAEGNNMLVTDVMTEPNATLSFTSGNRSIARATPCAIQVVKVGSVKTGYEVGINDLGRFKIPAGETWDSVKLFDKNGNAVAITGHDATYVYFDWKITGDVCWWDYEFNGASGANPQNEGVDKVRLEWDGDRPHANDEYVTNVVGEVTNVSIRVPTRPWRNVTSWPAEATFVMYGKMVADSSRYQIVFGSSGYSNYNTIFLATGDASKNEVVLCRANGNAAGKGEGVVEKLCSMTVPNAQTANHLYAFVLKTVGGNSEVDIYLDGELLQPYVFDGQFALGPGFQIASPHGGPVTGYSRPANDDPATLDWLRVYDLELNKAAMAEYARHYPYVSPNGSYRRAFSGAEDWDSFESWTEEGTSPVAMTNLPPANSTVKISADAAATIGVNLAESVSYEAITFSGEAISVVRGAASGKVRSSGRVTVDADVTFAYDAYEMAGAPLTVKDGRTVTFDMTSVDLDTIWADTSYDLSGLVSTGADVRIECTYGTVPAGRSVSYGIDPVDSHYKFVVTVVETLTAELSGTANFSDLVWKMGDVVVTPAWQYVRRAAINVKTDDAVLNMNSTLNVPDLTFVFSGGHALSLAKPAAVTISGVKYDVTGLNAKATFKYDPDPSHVLAGYVRYDLDMGEVSIATGMPNDATYEFKQATLTGCAGKQGGKTVCVPAGDVITLKNGSFADVRASVSLDVCGGTVYLAPEDNGAVWYGDGTTRFSLSSGTVYARATGQGQSGSGNGLLLGWSGAPREFTVSGGLLDVSDSSINFWSAVVTNNVSGGGVIRAKGVFKGQNAGVVNVTENGTFEIGSLGWKAGSATFNVDGGVLRGFEDGAIVSNAVNLVGNGTVSSAVGAEMTVAGAVQGAGRLTVGQAAAYGTVTLAGTNTFSGGTDVATGIAKTGHSKAFGEGDVDVREGASVDLSGVGVENLIRLTGSGMGGMGAIANTGAAMEDGVALNWVLAGDATVGGTARIFGGADSSVDLAGYRLTVAGNLALATNVAENAAGGTVVLSDGTFATAGDVSLGKASLVVQSGGTLDLSAGASVSCQDFKTSGKISGSVATLVVGGTLDATESVTVPRLSFAYGATLSGVGLKVTVSLTLGHLLNVEAPEGQSRIATVPESTVVNATSVVYNGKGGYTLRRSGTALQIVKEDVVTAHVMISNTVAGVNFETIKVVGSITDFEGGHAYGDTNVYVTLTADDGTVITRKFQYDGTRGGAFEYEIGGIEQGGAYEISARVEIEGAEVEASSSRVSSVVARPIAGWIDEDADTFAGRRGGTGYWSGTNGVASAEDGVICFRAADWSALTSFDPTNNTLSARSSTIRDIHYWAQFSCPGFYSCEEAPVVPSDGFAAVTLVSDEDGVCNFAVASNDVWAIIPREVYAPKTGVEYELFLRLVTTSNRNTVVYNVVTDDGLVRLAEAPFALQTPDLMLEFSGSGDVAKIAGTCEDPHLMQVGDEEFWNFDDARAAAGSTNNIIPLWWSRYVVKDSDGLFRLLDPKGLLELIWKKWYHWFVTKDGDVKIYRYLVGNNWIEYADVSGVVRTKGGWLVTNEVGLAWIAESATNQWFCGDVTLGRSLDLSSKNWTPIAQFSGTFDGAGYAIAGLNNTNVVEELGEAGRYPLGPTNDWGRTAYGLFATATNATMRDVVFERVAIDNLSEAVAALLGAHEGGDLTVSGVTVADGVVRGTGGAVAGVIGTSDGWNDLEVVNNENGAVIEAAAENDEPRWAAGILTVGGTNDTVGTLVVTGNVNAGTIANVIRNSEDGGNVAQIVAGTTWGTKFGDVVATNNVASGDFDVERVGHEGYAINLPVCNFAAAVTRVLADGGYRRFVEANDPASVPVDPHLRTARMSAGEFANGAENVAGWWIDAITATPAGGHFDVTGSGNVIDLWDTVLVDRDLSFNMNSNFIYMVAQSNSVFAVSDGVSATVSNGVIYVGEDCEAFSGDTAWLTTNDVKVVKLDEDFYERTVMLVDGYFLSVTEALDYLHAGACIELFEDTGLTIDAAANAVLLDGLKIADLPDYQSLVAAGEGGAVAYMVRLNEKALPDYDFELTGVSGQNDTVKINVIGARAGFYYAIQHKASLVENWSEPTAEDWVPVTTDGSLIQFTLPASESSGFYRIKVTDYLAGEE